MAEHRVGANIRQVTWLHTLGEKNRVGRTGGGVAACFKSNLQTQEVTPDLPHLMEALFFRIVLKDNIGLLLCILPET